MSLEFLLQRVLTSHFLRGKKKLMNQNVLSYLSEAGE